MIDSRRPRSAAFIHSSLQAVIGELAQQVALVGAFTTLMLISYVVHVSPVWSYLGLTYGRPPSYLLLPSVVAILLPLPFMHRNIESPGSLASVYVYFVLYVPSMIVPYMQRAAEGRALNVPETFVPVIVIGFLAFQWGSGRTPRREGLNLPRLSSSSADAVVYGLAGFLTVLLLYSFGGQVKVAGLSDVVEQRLIAVDVVTGNPLLGYASSWLQYSLAPFLLAWGLCTKRYGRTAMAFAAGGVVYATSAARSILFMFALIVGVSWG